MEKLLKLLNEYEESRWETIDDGLTEEEREEGGSIEYEEDRWREYEGHLRLANANTVAFERDTFDAYAISKRYGFVKWLVNHGKLGTKFLEPMLKMNKRYHLGTHDTIQMYLATKDDPIKALLSMLK